MATLPEFLEEREAELLAEMKAIGEQIAALQAKLLPLETELSAVRRCKATVADKRQTVGIEFSQIGPSLAELLAADFITVHGGIPGASTASAASGSAKLVTRLSGTGAVSYADLTMKELVMKALTDHFPNGASTRKLLEFFRDAWGRNIERTNLSPQISRLYQDGVVGRIPSTREWFLIQQEGIIKGFRPCRRLGDGQIVYVAQEQGHDDRYEPLLMRDFEGRQPYQRYATVGSRLLPVGPIKWLLPEEVPPDHQLVAQALPAPDLDDED